MYLKDYAQVHYFWSILFHFVFCFLNQMLAFLRCINFALQRQIKNHKIKSGLIQTILFSVYPIDSSWRICIAVHHFSTGTLVKDANFSQAGIHSKPRTWTSTTWTSPSAPSLSITALNSPNKESPQRPAKQIPTSSKWIICTNCFIFLVSSSEPAHLSALQIFWKDSVSDRLKLLLLLLD